MLAGIAGGMLLALSGCSSTGATSQVGHYVVRVPQSPMFRYGPAQSFGPDFSLQQGQHVVMLKREYGYSRVMTDDGQSGYVATEDLTPAPPPTVAKPSGGNRGLLARAGALPPRGTARPGISSANNQVIQGGPLFGDDLPPLPPLPEKDPMQSSSPGFRITVPAPSTDSGSGNADKPKESAPSKGKPGFRVNVPPPERR